MRMLTLAKGFESRGHSVKFLTANSGIHWLEDELKNSNLDISHVHSDSLDHKLLTALDPDLVVFDGYQFDRVDTLRLFDAGRPSLAVIDGNDLGYAAQLFLDQTPGAESGALALRLGERLLAGSRYSLIRTEVLGQRAIRERSGTRSAQASGSSGLVVLGGSDPAEAAVTIDRIIELLRAEVAIAIFGAPQPSEGRTKLNHRVHYFEPGPDLVSHFGRVDWAISAAGSTSLELMTCGVATALLTVADNQLNTYEWLTSHGMVCGLGSLASIRANIRATVDRLEEFIQDREGRDAMSASGMATFDGLGTVRVVRAVEQMIFGSSTG